MGGSACELWHVTVEEAGGGVPVEKISKNICPRPAGENIILQKTSLCTDRPPTIGGLAEC